MRNGARIAACDLSGTIHPSCAPFGSCRCCCQRVSGADPVPLELNSFTQTSQRLISYVRRDRRGPSLSCCWTGGAGPVGANAGKARRGGSDPFCAGPRSPRITSLPRNEPETGRFDFTFSRAVRNGEQSHAGVILVGSHLAPASWNRWRGPHVLEARVPEPTARRHHLCRPSRAWRGRTEGRKALALRAARKNANPAGDRRARANFGFGEQRPDIITEPRRSGSKTASRPGWARELATRLHPR